MNKILPETTPQPEGGLLLPKGSVAASQEFLRWLEASREEIIEKWTEELCNLSHAYRRRSTMELYGTATEAFEANLEALAGMGKERMDRFIDYITDKRLAAGFPLSDVQRAFELFRTIMVRRLISDGKHGMLAQCLEAVNACLAYTIHRFSDYFQSMHESAIRRHAKSLERTVRLRTAELAESERRYKTLVNEINDGFFIIQGGRIAFANQAFCRMHGAALEEVVGRLFADFVAPDCRERVMSAYRTSLVQRLDSGRLEYTRTGCPPQEAHTEIKSKVVDMGQGPVTIGICRDISRQVAMEAKIRENERLAYVGHIAASLSHEIRNPLSTCTLNMQILEEGRKLEGFDRRRLEITIKELTRLEDILHQLLDIARPLSIAPAPVDISQIASYCLDLMESKAIQKNVNLRRRQKAGLAKALADAAKIEQAMINLLLNAIEAVKPGGKVTVWTREVAEGERALVELGVHDNGPGIAPEQEPHLFTPFFTSKSRGTGLGLSNVKRIVEAHTGNISVKSRPGSGAAFVLRLPCAP